MGTRWGAGIGATAPVDVGGEARVVGDLGGFHGVEQTLPVALVGGTDGKPAVLRLERLVRPVQGMRRTHRAGRDAGRERDRALPVGMHDAGFEQ